MQAKVALGKQLTASEELALNPKLLKFMLFNPARVSCCSGTDARVDVWVSAWMSVPVQERMEQIVLQAHVVCPVRRAGEASI
jgi:hypothetical protein